MDDNLSSFEYSHNDHCIYAHYKDKTGSLRVSAKVLNTDLPLPVGDKSERQDLIDLIDSAKDALVMYDQKQALLK